MDYIEILKKLKRETVYQIIFEINNHLKYRQIVKRNLKVVKQQSPIS